MEAGLIGGADRELRSRAGVAVVRVSGQRIDGGTDVLRPDVLTPAGAPVAEPDLVPSIASLIHSVEQLPTWYIYIQQGRIFLCADRYAVLIGMSQTRF